MNKKLVFLVVGVGVLGMAYWFINSKGWSTLRPELKDFAIKDTAAITRIFLADKRGNRVELQEKDNQVWWLNGKYEADPTKVNLILATMHDVSVRNPVPEPSFNTVIGTLATDGVKAEFYSGNDLIKTLYVGSATPDQTGTFMLLDGSSAPFITHIQGFVGYLSPRFFPIEIKWKTRKLFVYKPEEIASVKVQFPGTPDQSYEVINTGSEPQLIAQGSQVIIPEPQFIKYYLGGFENLYIEGYEESRTQNEIDSIRKLQPFCIIQVKDQKGVETKLTVHYKIVGDHTRQLYDESGNERPYDIEKYFAFINDEQEMAYVQDYTFGKIFRKLNDFKKARQIKP